MDFKMAKKYNMQMYYCSASDGTNVVKVNFRFDKNFRPEVWFEKFDLKVFNDAIKAAHDYKLKTTDFMDAVMEELQVKERTF